MRTQEEKDQVIALRKSGLSIRNVARQTGLAISTVSGWCRGIELSDAERRRVALAAKPHQAAAQRRAVLKNKELMLARHASARSRGVAMLPALSSEHVLLVGLGLYLGDGYKAGGDCGFSNSNAAIQRFMISWFENCFGVCRDRFRCRVVIHEKYRDDEDAICREWCEELGLPRSALTGVTFITSKRPPPYAERGLYKGTLSLKVRRGNEIFHQILGMADAVVYKGGTHRPG